MLCKSDKPSIIIIIIHIVTEYGPTDLLWTLCLPAHLLPSNLSHHPCPLPAHLLLSNLIPALWTYTAFIVHQVLISISPYTVQTQQPALGLQDVFTQHAHITCRTQDSTC